MFSIDRVGRQEDVKALPVPVNRRIGADHLTKIEAGKGHRIVAAAIKGEDFPGPARIALQLVDRVDVQQPAINHLQAVH